MYDAASRGLRDTPAVLIPVDKKVDGIKQQEQQHFLASPASSKEGVCHGVCREMQWRCNERGVRSAGWLRGAGLMRI